MGGGETWDSSVSCIFGIYIAAVAQCVEHYANSRADNWGLQFESQPKKKMNVIIQGQKQTGLTRWPGRTGDMLIRDSCD